MFKMLMASKGHIINIITENSREVMLWINMM